MGSWGDEGGALGRRARGGARAIERCSCVSAMCRDMVVMTVYLMTADHLSFKKFMNFQTLFNTVIFHGNRRLEQLFLVGSNKYIQLRLFL
jgi:hypothetical protein